ncbi:DUF6980 family protein [Modestobacter roseus]|uniref:DUF6980 family protein n=1 Tax=Modestobacter roseus TaxID=1181884 RepID=UPI003F69003D
MKQALGDTSIPVGYDDTYREYGIGIQDGGSSTLVITFCPFCGSGLPSSLRDKWFDRLEELGVEPGEGNIPVHYLTGAWWRRVGDDES